MSVFCMNVCPECKNVLASVTSNDSYFYKGSLRVITHEGGYCLWCKQYYFNKRKLDADELLLEMFCERVDEKQMVNKET